MFMHINRFITLFENIFDVDILLSEGFNPSSFLSKVQSVATLARRGATEGERSASIEALKRLLDRAQEEARAMSHGDAQQFLRRVKDASSDTQKEEPKPQYKRPEYKEYKRPQEFPTGSWVYVFDKRKAGKITRYIAYATGTYFIDVPGMETFSAKTAEIRRATQDEIDSSLGNVKAKESSVDQWIIIDFAKFVDEKSNKVYGTAFNHTNKESVCFWGRHAGPYSIKKYSSLPECHEQYLSKRKKGYIVPTDLVTELAKAKFLFDQAIKKQS
jgi:hypothetical protein